MARNRALAGLLALATILLAVVGETTVLMHAGGPLGLLAIACAAPVGMAAWIVLGAPTTRADLRD